MIFAVATLLAFVVSNILNRLKDLKELQEKSTIENIQFEIESGLADLAEKMQKFNDEVADWDDDNQKVSFDPSVVRLNHDFVKMMDHRPKISNESILVHPSGNDQNEGKSVPICSNGSVFRYLRMERFLSFAKAKIFLKHSKRRRKLEIQRPFYFSITNKCQDVKKRETGYVRLVTSHYLLEKSQTLLQLNSSIS